MTISREEWADWLRSPVTEAVVNHLSSRRDSAIEELLNLTADTTEQFGVKHIAYRNQLEGLGEFLDLDSLKEWICED